VYSFNGNNESLIVVIDESDTVRSGNRNNRWDFEFSVWLLLRCGSCFRDCGCLLSVF
jgi:hypothetical protein